MAELVSGANTELSGTVISMELPGPFDLSALVLGPDGRVSGDRDMVFYNQRSAPGVMLRATPGSPAIELDLGRLRPGAERVVLVASPADGVTPFGRLPTPQATVSAAGRTVATLRPPPLGTQTVLQIAEIYRRGPGWKLRALGAGYADGLAGLARDFGVDVDDSPPVPASGRSVPVPAFGRSAPVPPPAAPGDVLAEVLALTNAERARAGLAALTAEPRLAAAAARHSADMAARGFFAHDTPEGISVADRVRAAGYDYSVVAENIAAGQRTAREVVAGWMDSPGHRANILRPQVRQLGVGRVEGGEYGVYWTQVFGSPR
ncbi:CAP domain-containing protein [Parafrankia sp. EUN1f]|uniref:CAP domain-containing protein n=1 Tax=Parafrankia sp. EUN1f TaxID=102897 RepID=UPI0001C44B1D|nr:CAP domain-containing protein [Parafrankia sp. EUN1f]EFC82489.1 SCP-like extracellular [Parafrankia sp. EUN1f]